MFISIPKEFFVPVIFSDGFILNQENDHLELDTNLYRKSSESEKYSEIEISKKANLDESLNVNNELNNFNDSHDILSVFICSFIFLAVSGKNAEIMTEANLKLSTKL